MKVITDFREVYQKIPKIRREIVADASTQLFQKCVPYLPELTGRLKQSGYAYSKPEQGQLVWVAPYAVMRWNHAKHRGLKGSKWAFRCWYDCKHQILRNTAQKVGGKYIL